MNVPNRHHLRSDLTLSSYMGTILVSPLRHLALLMFWRDTVYKSNYWESSTCSDDHLLLVQGFLMDIKFSSNLWYFPAWITCYICRLLRMKLMNNFCKYGYRCRMHANHCITIRMYLIERNSRFIRKWIPSIKFI